MFPALYAILDPNFCAVLTLSEIAIKLSDAGVQLFQLRDKKATARTLYAEAADILQALSGRDVRILVNDRADIAAMVGAGGVHVGQEDLPVDDARKISGPNLWVGVSTHNLAQFREAIAASADYIAVGPVYPTATKENPDPLVGLELLRSVRPLTRKPIVAIGGITLETAEEVYRAGADSIAVIRDLCSSSDPGARAAEYLAVAERVRRSLA